MMKQLLHKTKRLIALLTLAALLALPGMGWGQSISVGTPYTQNFDGIGTTATASLPTGWKIENVTGARTVTTAYASVANTATANALLYNAAMSSSASNGRWNFGGSSATDRAVGGISSSSASQSVNMYLQLTNNGASSIESFTINFDAERYRNGTNAAGFSIRVYYSITGAASSWTEITSCVASFAGGNANNNGSTTNPMEVINITNKTLTQSVAAGSSIYLVWSYSVTSTTTTSNAQALGIDNISITANGSSIPTISTPSPNSLTGFTTTSGTASASQTFSVGGSNLTENLVVSAPVDYEVRENGTGSFGSAVSFTPSSGTVATKTIEVRIAASAGVGSPSGNVVCSSTGATSHNVAVSGTVTAPPTNYPPSISNIVRTPSGTITNSIAVSISADASDSDGTVEGVELHWGTSSGSLGNTIEMSLDAGNTYIADTDIPAQAGGTTVYYEIYAIDDDADETTSAEQSYSVIFGEPSNHASSFAAAASTSSQVTVTWTDASVGQLPSGYLIKAAVSPATPVAPEDGTVESDATLVKNIAQGVGTVTFTGLSAETTYNFSIWPYTNSGAAIDYKIGSEPIANATTEEGPAYSVGDFGFTVASGSWGTNNANWKQWDGSGWNTIPSGIPAITDNVYILSGNTCIIEVSGKNCKNLTVESGAKLFTGNSTMSTPRYVNVGGNITCDGTIGNGSGTDDVISFNISGGITSTVSGSGSFTANRVRRNNGSGILNLIIATNIELRYNGDALLNNTSTPDATQAFNITINEGKHANLIGNGATPTAGYALKSVDLATIYGKLTITGTLTNAAGNSGIVIKSTAAGTGSLIHSTAGVSATVERYLANYNAVGDQMFHLISSPVAEQAIRPEFVSNEATIPAGTDFYSFSEATNEWINTRADGNVWNSSFEPSFTVGKGYLVAYPTNVTKNFTGTLNSSQVVLTCSKTSGQGEGWNLLGNPFPSAIDWNLVTKGAGMDNALYYYDNSQQKYRYFVQFSGDDGTYTIGSGSQYIPAMQGFMAHASINEATLTIPVTAKTHSGQNTFYKSTETVPGSLVLKVAAHGHEDEAYIHFNRQATTAFDGAYDAYKLRSYSNVVPNLYTKGSDGSDLAINGLPELDAATVIPVHFEAAAQGEQVLTANLDGLHNAIVYLEDSKLGKTHNLSQNPVYSFTSASGDNVNRFKLLFGSVGISTPETSSIQVYTLEGRVYVNGAPANAQLSLTDITGRLVQRTQLENSGLNTVNVGNLPHGVYVVTVNDGKHLVSHKIIL